MTHPAPRPFAILLAAGLSGLAGMAHGADPEDEADADIAAEMALGKDEGAPDLAAAATAPVIEAGAGLEMTVPSGQKLVLQDVIWNVPGPMGLATRFRFVAPGIAPGGGVDFDTASADMQALCDGFALPRVADNTPAPEQIIISFSAAPVPFGEAAPEVAQYFESYRIENGSCEWEMF